MLTTIAKKIFGTKNARVLKSMRPSVVRIGELEPELKGKSDDELRAKTVAFRERIAYGAEVSGWRGVNTVKAPPLFGRAATSKKRSLPSKAVQEHWLSLQDSQPSHSPC